MDKREVLKRYFGYREFRPGQELLIDQILSGRDTLGIMPTGAGKSVCFQVPAMMMPGICLVISPLISLMKDQVNGLVQSGIPAAFINSSLTFPEYKRTLDGAKAGKYRLIYIAPERLLNENFLAFAKGARISMVTVDEAHCVSQWGQDFRPSYLKIPEFLHALDARPVVSAFTATATAQVREDIAEKLELDDPFVLTTGFDRKNLYFAVEKPKNKLTALVRHIQRNQSKCGIVYCATRKAVEEVSSFLTQAGIAAGRYHAGMEDDERRLSQEDFLYDRFQVMVATNAFGMGIDKSNVGFVIHYNMPMNLESYYQEAGRAGRDGSPAECILLYGGQDVITNQFLIEKGQENEELDEEQVRQLKIKNLALLKQMTFYCHTQECLRGFILRYFGEQAENFCGNCSNCVGKFEDRDVTVEAQKILSCIRRMGENYGAKMVVDVLRGSRQQRVLQLGFDQLSTYGIMKDDSAEKIWDILNYLELHGFIEKVGDKYPVLHLTGRAREILFDGVQVEMKIRIETENEPQKRQDFGQEVYDPALFAKLRELRGELARRQSIPAYVVFSDATLRDMCIKMPTTPHEFLDVAGVGKAKLKQYGEVFLRQIREFRRELAEKS